MTARADAHSQTRGGDRELDPYREIHRHAEFELELAGRGELDGLSELAEHWEQLIAGLPSRPPRAAAQLLEQAQLIHERTRIELIRLREALLLELTSTARGRRAADGYGGQLRRRPITDLTA